MARNPYMDSVATWAKQSSPVPYPAAVPMPPPMVPMHPMHPPPPQAPGQAAALLDQLKGAVAQSVQKMPDGPNKELVGKMLNHVAQATQPQPQPMPVMGAQPMMPVGMQTAAPIAVPAAIPPEMIRAFNDGRADAALALQQTQAMQAELLEMRRQNAHLMQLLDANTKQLVALTDAFNKLPSAVVELVARMTEDPNASPNSDDDSKEE